MSTFQVLAARIEAAISAYCEVRDFADKSEWKKALEKEAVSALFRGPTSFFIRSPFVLDEYSSRVQPGFQGKSKTTDMAAPRHRRAIQRVAIR